jgi:hypothetical protein
VIDVNLQIVSGTANGSDAEAAAAVGIGGRAGVGRRLKKTSETFIDPR